jgi:carboxyl-terminal processing protease
MNWQTRIQWLIVIIAWFAIGWILRGLLLPPIDQELALLGQAEQIMAHESYGEAPPPRQMAYAAIKGMLNSLGDKYAAFFEPTIAVRYDIEARGEDAITGLRGEVQGNAFVITDVLPGEPAAEAGLEVGDIITEIDGWQVPAAPDYTEVIAMVRGPAGSVAHIVVMRGNRNLHFDVSRKPAQDITTRMLESDIAYLRLDRFTDQTPQQVESALRLLLSNTPRGLIWDLRYNGGGKLEATRQVLDLFLDEGIAFYARTRDGSLLPYRTKSGSLAEKIPLVVLIGPYTYSAPEIVAAAVADRGRGTLLGEQTYGKGSITATSALPDGSALRLTVARWLSPVHQESYEGKGVPPDVIAKDEPHAAIDSVLQSAVDYFRYELP